MEKFCLRKFGRAILEMSNFHSSPFEKYQVSFLWKVVEISYFYRKAVARYLWNSFLMIFLYIAKNHLFSGNSYIPSQRVIFSSMGDLLPNIITSPTGTVNKNGGSVLCCFCPARGQSIPYSFRRTVCKHENYFCQFA